MYDLIGFGVFVSPLKLDLKLLLSMIKKSLKPVSVRLKKIKVSGVQISEKTSATIDLTSIGNPISDLDSSFDLSKTTLERMKGTLIRGGISTEIELSKNGSFMYSDNFHEELLPIIKDYKIFGTPQAPYSK
ncbi:hypothetical protein [Endozoicomonas sp. SCSIO W0465]|uniref:hypothetical protein n=1 Tax=Endozoicomonas sp. SCSIO W0465 TaxID=2918516 RepID=UPI002075B4C7|nr:hypothetical protein [Endozoicomonas sp. SCSIO W0465]USE36853.1 hypothetical protein MJO57_01000 [Endozoicomonas sp. SCSIO W0465]